jgi:tetratricopeptide (TPR) repeat protein
MKKLNLLLFFLVAATMVAFAQKPKIEKAKALLDKNEIAEAKSIIDAAVDFDKTKDKVKTWYYRGLIYEAINNSEDPSVQNLSDNAFEEAVEAFKKVKEMEGENGTYFIFAEQQLNSLYSSAFNTAAEAYQNEEYQKAIDHFEKVKSIYPDDTTAWMYTGYAANQVGNIDLAMENFEYLAENKMADVNVHRNIIYTYRAVEKDTAKAISAAERAREQFPDDPDLKQDEITLLIIANETEAAKEKIQAAIDKNPDDHVLYYEMGYLYDASDELDKAIEWYKKAIDKNPEYFDALYNLGVDYYNKGADILHQAQEMDLDTYKKEGKKVEEQANEVFKQALPYFERAHEVRPDDVGTLETLQTLYSLMKNYEKVNEVQQKLEALGVSSGMEGGE